MNTYLEIPAYLRRAESDAMGDPDALKHHAEGYADTMLSIQAAEMKSIITTHLTDINNRHPGYRRSSLSASVGYGSAG
jgi:hypothetical protein